MATGGKRRPRRAVIGTVGPITNASAATATFTAPTAAGHYYLRLTVTDTVTRRSDVDVVRVTVQEAMTVRVSVDGGSSVNEGGSASLVVGVGRRAAGVGHCGGLPG